MSNKLLVVHGVGMNMRGKVQIETFGSMTLPEYDEHIRRYAKELDLDVEIFHSNIEGEVINRLYEADDENFIGAIMNPAAYMIRASRAVCRNRSSLLPSMGNPYVEPCEARPNLRDGERRARRRHRPWHSWLLRRDDRGKAFHE